jgi:hypothetical protein
MKIAIAYLGGHHFDCLAVLLGIAASQGDVGLDDFDF